MVFRPAVIGKRESAEPSHSRVPPAHSPAGIRTTLLLTETVRATSTATDEPGRSNPGTHPSWDGCLAPPATPSPDRV